MLYTFDYIYKGESEIPMSMDGMIHEFNYVKKYELMSAIEVINKTSTYPIETIVGLFDRFFKHKISKNNTLKISELTKAILTGEYSKFVDNFPVEIPELKSTTIETYENFDMGYMDNTHNHEIKLEYIDIVTSTNAFDDLNTTKKNAIGELDATHNLNILTHIKLNHNNNQFNTPTQAIELFNNIYTGTKIESYTRELLKFESPTNPNTNYTLGSLFKMAEMIGNMSYLAQYNDLEGWVPLIIFIHLITIYTGDTQYLSDLSNRLNQATTHAQYILFAQGFYKNDNYEESDKYLSSECDSFSSDFEDD